MEIFDSKNNCCGCSACEQICPKNAIKMKPDDRGFLYPVIDNSLCVECGACKRVCAFQNGYEKNRAQKAYAIKHKDFNTRMTSRSGGVFIAISDFILEKNGSVYGASFDDYFSVCHIRTTNKSERDRLKGSKYVQSNVKDTFSNVKQDLKNGMYVLFSGTACQVGGLKNYLKNTDTSKLYTCDLVCHGVPSPKIWKEYLNHCEKKYNGKVTNANFRDKTLGWNAHKEAIWIDGKKYNSNEYAYLFNDNYISRPSCFNCKFTNLDRPADFTLADFWGINNILPEFNDNKGVSLLLVNSSKGAEVLEACKKDIECFECDLQKSAKPNPNLYMSSQKPKDGDYFWNNYEKYGFEKALNKCYKKVFWVKLKIRIREKSNKVKRIFKK